MTREERKQEQAALIRFYLDHGGALQEYPDAGAVVVRYGRFKAIAFHGDNKRPDFHFRFKTEEARENYISSFTDSHLAVFLEPSKFPLKGSLFSSGPVPPFSRVVPSGDGYSDSVTVSRYDITLFNLTRPFDSVGHVSLLGDRGGVVSFRAYYLQFLCEIFDVPEITIRFYPFPSMVSVPGCGFAILAFTAVNELRFLSPKMTARHDKIFSSRFA